jgi:hypothetical protein
VLTINHFPKIPRPPPFSHFASLGLSRGFHDPGLQRGPRLNPTSISPVILASSRPAKIVSVLHCLHSGQGGRGRYRWLCRLTHRTWNVDVFVDAVFASP